MSGSKPGERRGGRPKGSPNKRTAALREAAGKHAAGSLEAIRQISDELWAEGDKQGALRGYIELAQYEAPKLRSIEVKKTSTAGDFTLAELLGTLRSIQLAKREVKTPYPTDAEWNAAVHNANS